MVAATRRGIAHGPMTPSLRPVDDGDPYLAAWRSNKAPVPGAAKVDPRAIDPEGPAGQVSLVLAPEGVWLSLDDVAVSRAMRAAMTVRPVDVLSTLVVGNDRFTGALTAVFDAFRQVSAERHPAQRSPPS